MGSSSSLPLLCQTQWLSSSDNCLGEDLGVMLRAKVVQGATEMIHTLHTPASLAPKSATLSPMYVYVESATQACDQVCSECNVA